MNQKLTDARAMEKVNNFDRAIQLMTEATTMGPHEAILWFELGNAQHGAGKFDEAIVSFERATQENASSSKPSAALERAIEINVAVAKDKTGQSRTAVDAGGMSSELSKTAIQTAGYDSQRFARELIYASHYHIPIATLDSPYSYNADSKLYEQEIKSFRKTGHGNYSMWAIRAGMSALDGRDIGNYNEAKTRKQDVGKALDWFQKGEATAAYPLALYPDYGGYIGYRLLGQGEPAVTPNAAQAEYWLKFATCQIQFSSYPDGGCKFDSTAAYNLGVAYLRGDVLAKDPVRGVALLERASSNWGDADATGLLAKLYAEGIFVPKNEKRSAVLAASARKGLSQQAQQDSERELELHTKQLEVAVSAAQSKAEAHAATINALSGALASAASAAGQPNAIEDAKNAGLARTAAIAARGREAAAEPRPSTSVGGGFGVSSPCSRLAKDCMDSKPIADSRTVPTSAKAQTSTVRNAPIVPDPIYAATPASGVCPPSGYYMSQTGDVSVGIPCSPGKPLPASGSQGSAPPSTGGSGNAGQSGTNGNPHHLISPRGDLQQCVTFDFNGQTSLRGQLGWDRYSNTCQQAVNVTVVFQDGQGGASEMDIDAGKTGGLAKNRKEYADHGGSSYYVCPAGYGAADVQGNYLYKTRVTQYMCRQHGW